MKWLYLTKMDFTNPATGGLFRKVQAQCRAMNGCAGIEMKLFFIRGNEVFLEGPSGVQKVCVFRHTLHRIWFLYAGVFHWMDRQGYSGIYIRHFLLNPMFVFGLWRWRRRSGGRKVLLELPTYPYVNEFRDARGALRLQVWLDQRMLSWLRYMVDRIVTFSRQDRIAGIPTLVTDNGIDPERIAANPGHASFPPLRILGLANLNIWHGYDRIIRALSDWRPSEEAPPIRFEIAGSGKEEGRLRQLVDDLSLSEVVTFHGFLQGEPLDRLVASCHVGVASLGMHRTGVADGQTTTLKAREFAAGGIPFILGYTDHDFQPPYPYCLRVPADESPVDLHQVVGFYTDLVSNHPDYANRMRADAMARLSWEAKMGPVVDWILAGS